MNENDFKLLLNGSEKMFKEFFNIDTNKSQRANMWTFLRLVIPFLTVGCSVKSLTNEKNKNIYLRSAATLTLFGALTDFLDGKSARKHNSESEYGKLLDQVSDKFFAGTLATNLVFINKNYLSILLAETSIGLINTYYKLNYDIKGKSTMAGKVKEWPLFISLALGYMSNMNETMKQISDASIITTCVFEAVTINSYINQNKKLVKQKTL